MAQFGCPLIAPMIIEVADIEASLLEGMNTALTDSDDSLKSGDSFATEIGQAWRVQDRNAPLTMVLHQPTTLPPPIGSLQ
jgi:hypothetical protein